jgi:hypothetical protein
MQDPMSLLVIKIAPLRPWKGQPVATGGLSSRQTGAVASFCRIEFSLAFALLMHPELSP